MTPFFALGVSQPQIGVTLTYGCIITTSLHDDTMWRFDEGVRGEANPLEIQVPKLPSE
jgi:hypothetical protein